MDRQWNCLEFGNEGFVFFWHSPAVADTLLNMMPINAQLSNGSSGDWLPAFLLIYGLVWLVVLAQILQCSDLDPVTKLTWVIVVIFVPFFGMLLYWTIAPSNSKNSPREFSNKIDPSNQLSGTPWENNPGYSAKSK